MNKSLQTGIRRTQYAIAETDAPVVKGEVVTKSERQRIRDWLAKRGEPNLSAFRRTKR